MQTMRLWSPYIAVVVLVAQLLSSGALGPRMLCAHRDGSQSIELAVTSCCGGSRAQTTASESVCGGCDGGCHEDRSGLVLSQPDCDCIDTPVAGEPMVRQAPQSTPQHELAATFVAVVAVLMIDLSPLNASGFTHRAALPECLAPPRAHLATIVLRL